MRNFVWITAFLALQFCIVATESIGKSNIKTFQGNTTAEIKMDWCEPFTDLADENTVFFYLYTKQNPEIRQRLRINNIESIKNSYFQANKPTVVYSHGFTSSAKSEGAMLIKNAYMKHEDFFNVIIVDWCKLAVFSTRNTSPENREIFYCDPPDELLVSEFSTQPINNSTVIPYFSPACNTQSVGKFVAEFLNFLQENQYLQESKVHLIGHSLGAHVSGRAGNVYQTNYGKKLGRITGLDPAKPQFDEAPLDKRLDPTDAEFVDVIHTAGRITESWNPIPSLGYLAPLGHLDFYPNDGNPYQPGCHFYNSTCSHSRAYEYYAESVNQPSAFLGCKCTDWRKCSENAKCNGSGSAVKMGFEAPHLTNDPLNMWYYMKTNDRRPFGKGDPNKQCNSVMDENMLDPAHPQIWLVDVLAANCHNKGLCYKVLLDTSTRLPIASIAFVDKENENTDNVPELDYWRPYEHHCINSTHQPRCVGTPSPDGFNKQRLRGHLTPTIASSYDYDAMYSTSYCLNAAPQDEFANSPVWSTLENYVFEFSESNPAYVFTGTCAATFPYGQGKLPVPQCFWKLVCQIYQEGNNHVAQAVGFILRNREHPVTCESNEADKDSMFEDIKNAYTINEIQEQSGWGNFIDLVFQDKYIGDLYRPASFRQEIDPRICLSANLLAVNTSRIEELSSRASSCNCGCQDDTVEERAHGQNVVFQTARLISKSRIFLEDYQFLFRLALVASQFGDNLDTFRPNYYGGIWQIDEAVYLSTKNTIDSKTNDALIQHFGINWRSTSWKDLEMPMHSAIAARLVYKNDNIPLTVEKQAILCSQHGSISKKKFVDDVTKYYKDYPPSARFDLITSLDGSGSIGANEFIVAKNITALFMKATAELTKEHGVVRQGLILFSTESELIVSLHDGRTPSELEKIANALPYPNGGTKTHLAIEDTIEMFTEYADHETANVAVILTDGNSNNPQLTKEAAAKLKQQGITSFAIGVGSAITQSELLTLASGDSTRVFRADNFGDLLELYLWLTAEASVVPRRPAMNTTLTDGIQKSELHYFVFDVPSQGVTFEVINLLGSTKAYYSFSADTPSNSLHEGVIENGLTFIPFKTSFGKADGSKLYVSVQGSEPNSTYSLVAHEGFVEGCGLRGIYSDTIILDPVLENTGGGISLGIFETYTYETLAINQLDGMYVDQVIMDGAISIVTKNRFPKYIMEQRQEIMNTTAFFSCPKGQQKEYTFQIRVIDENNQSPEFSKPSLHLKISPSHDLNIAINENEPLTVWDNDLQESNSNLGVWTDNPLVSFQMEQLWIEPLPEKYEYKITLFYRALPETTRDEFVVFVDDGANLANITVVVDIDLSLE